MTPPVRGSLSHIDLSVSDPDRAIPFYDAFFRALGFRRFESAEPDFVGSNPRRAAWFIRYPGSPALFGVEVRPAAGVSRAREIDRYAPGTHHMAFHAESREAVDAIYAALRDAGGTVLDPPKDYGGQPAYGDSYYAVFFADPDGAKLEVVYEPTTNASS